MGNTYQPYAEDRSHRHENDMEHACVDDAGRLLADEYTEYSQVPGEVSDTLPAEQTE